MNGMKPIWNMMAISLLTAMLVIVLVLPASAQLADTPWPMFHHDLNHTGKSSYLGAQTGVEKWNFTTGNWIFWSSPAIDSDGTIYVGSSDHKLYAINPNGTEKWSFNTAHDIYSSPAIGSDGTIYVGSRIGNLYAINPDGTGKRSFVVGETFSSPAICSDGTIYIGSVNKLNAINSDGTEKWNFTTGGCVHSSPAIGSDGTIYGGSYTDNKLYAINSDGTAKWNFTTGGRVTSSPAIGSDGTIYAGSVDNKLYAINPDGTEKWNFTATSYIQRSPAIASDGTIYVGSADNKLYAVNLDGTEKWSFATGNTVFSSPAIGSDGTIYVGSHDMKLYAINPDGTEKWSFTTGGWILSSPSIAPDGTIYVGSRDHKLYAIGGISKIAFTTPARIIRGGEPSEIITIQMHDSAGDPRKVGEDTTINLTSTSATGKFSLSKDSWSDVTSVTIPAGSSSVSFYYKDTTIGNPTITASEYPNRAWTDGTQQETVTSSAFWYLRRTAASGFDFPAGHTSDKNMTGDAPTHTNAESVTLYAGNESWWYADRAAECELTFPSGDWEVTFWAGLNTGSQDTGKI